MNLACTAEYAVQAGWARIAFLKWLFLLTGLGATESGIDCRVAGAIIILGTLMFVATMFMDAISAL